jgi:hypothetical protein
MLYCRILSDYFNVKDLIVPETHIVEIDPVLPEIWVNKAIEDLSISVDCARHLTIALPLEGSYLMIFSDICERPITPKNSSIVSESADLRSYSEKFCSLGTLRSKYLQEVLNMCNLT